MESTTNQSILLYGAYGYTGQIICEEAQKAGVALILAGRSEEKLTALSYPDWEKRAFALDDPKKIDQNLKGIGVVLHAAGPFIHTAKSMMEACIRNKIHYTDITGEIAVFEMAHRNDQLAKQAGIVMLPGAGFDVVPTDCLAAHLKNKLPDATHLQLAFAALGGVSRGTALTMAQSLGEDGAVRENAKIIRKEIGHKTLQVPFHSKKLFCMTIPWGDVSTAYHSTGIPNIETYTSVKPSAFKWVKRQRKIKWLLRKNWVRNLAQNRIKKGTTGPSLSKRETGGSLVWGKVWNEAGKSKEARLKTINGYTLTAITSFWIAQKILQGKVSPGFQTPSNAFGADFILEVPDTEREDL